MNPCHTMRRILRIVAITTAIPLALLMVSRAPAVGSEEPSSRCDIQIGPCTKKTGDGMTIEFDIKPKPVAAMTESTFVVAVSRNGMPVTEASVLLDLSMPGMFMGRNRPVLKQGKAGRYEGTGIVTRCASGRKTWQADVTVESAGKTSFAAFVFEVK